MWLPHDEVFALYSLCVVSTVYVVFFAVSFRRGVLLCVM
jgi:hypothetical protein